MEVTGDCFVVRGWRDQGVRAEGAMVGHAGAGAKARRMSLAQCHVFGGCRAVGIVAGSKS